MDIEIPKPYFMSMEYKDNVPTKVKSLRLKVVYKLGVVQLYIRGSKVVGTMERENRWQINQALRP